MHDSNIAEKAKAAADCQLQDSLRLLSNERQTSEKLKVAKEDAMRSVEALRNALRKAEERMNEMEKESRTTQERQEQNSQKACRLAEQTKEELVAAESDLDEAKGDLDKAEVVTMVLFVKLHKAKSELNEVKSEFEKAKRKADEGRVISIFNKILKCDMISTVPIRVYYSLTLFMIKMSLTGLDSCAMLSQSLDTSGYTYLCNIYPHSY
ncbi:hypothetical protein EV361DRAFT_911003 [Lentinula raphanica]|nr:hypothetical protein EV361DRAFT_911003 [Lentinula raphanica]